MALSLRRLAPIDPRELLSGTWGEWVLIIILCGLFIAVAGAVLPKHLTEKRYGKALTIFVGLILGGGLYLAKDLYNFSLESFGLLAFGIIIILAAAVTFGLTRIGFSKSTAIGLSYCLVFLTFAMQKPSLFDSIARTLPILNLVFYLLFFFMMGKLVMGMFKHDKSAFDALRKIKDMDFKGSLPKETEKQIESEVATDKKEDKEIKKQTMKLTKREISSVDDMNHDLSDMQRLIRAKGKNIDKDEVAQLKHKLRRLAKEEDVLRRGLQLIPRQLNLYKLRHMKQLEFVRNRLHETKDAEQKKHLYRELESHKKALSTIETLKSLNQKALELKREFDRNVYAAMIRIREKRPDEAVALLNRSKRYLDDLRKIYENQKRLEKELIYINKKTINELKKEKNV